MAILFFDSSALLKRYHVEAGSDRVSQLLDQADQLVTSRLTQVEVTAALVRRGRATGHSTDELDRRLAAFERDVRIAFDVVELDVPLIEQAVALSRRHGLRAADAIQLACAVVARADGAQEGFTFVASDRELNTAAAAEQMQIIDPAAA